jgi:hypothetical protein
MDRILVLLTTCMHNSELQFTVHWYTQTSVFSLLQSPLAVSWQRFLQRQILQLSALRPSCHSHPCRTLVGWWPFHTNLLLVFTSQAHFQLNWQLNCCQLLPTTNSLLEIVLLVTSRHGPHRKHHSNIVASVFVGVETCLPNRCLEMGCVTPVGLLLRALPSNDPCLQSYCLATAPYATIRKRTYSVGLRVIGTFKPWNVVVLITSGHGQSPMCLSYHLQKAWNLIKYKCWDTVWQSNIWN